MDEVEGKLYGLVAEFAEPEALLKAARHARAEGYRRMNAYTPFPVEGLSEAVGFARTRFQGLVLLLALGGGVGAFLMQYLAATWHYPLNIGGRPLNSWPAFVPIIFELTVLTAALSSLVLMLGLNGLPRPHHPIFEAAAFDRASSDRFFLCIEAEDPRFDKMETKRFLERLEARSVSEVPLHG